MKKIKMKDDAMTDLTELSIYDASRLLTAGETTSVELTEAYLSRINERDGVINAYITVTAADALERAAEIDRRRASGEKLPPLAGIPAAVKDNIAVAGVKMTCASRMLEDFVPCYDAHVVERLKNAGVVPLGKLNMDEFAMGSSTETSAFGITRNPADITRVPGGSSGGSAAAVAAGMSCFTLGSDTGGSIRLPASYCGVVGVKPTYGTVSRYGLVAFASSLDQIGPLTKTVRDAAMVMDVLAGHDARDSTSAAEVYKPFGREIGESVRGIRIGVPREYFAEGLTDGVRTVTLDAVERLRSLGAAITDVSLPSMPDALAAYYVLSCAEASSNLARFDGIRYGSRAADAADLNELYIKSRTNGFGEEVKRRITTGSFVLSAGYFDAYYKKAAAIRDAIRADFADVFKKVDALISPVAPAPAFRLGAHSSDPAASYMTDVYTVPVNIAGIPAISVPSGVAEGLPVGVQLMCRHNDEATMFRIAAALEV